MSIEINNIAQTQARGASEGRGVAELRSSRVSGAGSDKGRASDDQLTLTDTAKRLGDLTQAAGSQPPVDRARVEEIRAAIQEGRYDVNADRVSTKLLQIESLL